MAGDEKRRKKLSDADNGVEIRVEEVVKVSDGDVKGRNGVIYARVVDKIVESGSGGVVAGREGMRLQGRGEGLDGLFGGDVQSRGDDEVWEA